MTKTILILNGPNLNLLGSREPEIYGATTLQDIEKNCADICEKLGFSLQFKQSNLEGELVTWVQDARVNSSALIINAGGYTHTSVALHDALKAYEKPIVEVHISNIYARESFRHTSLISPLAKGIICGFGIKGYELALLALKDMV